MSLLLLFRPRYGESAPTEPAPDTHDPGYYHTWRESDYRRYQDQLRKRYEKPTTRGARRKKENPSLKDSAAPAQIKRLTFEQLSQLAKEIAVRSEASIIGVDQVLAQLEAALLEYQSKAKAKREAEKLRLQQQVLLDLAILAEQERRRLRKIKLQHQLLLLLLTDE